MKEGDLQKRIEELADKLKIKDDAYENQKYFIIKKQLLGKCIILKARYNKCDKAKHIKKIKAQRLT